MVKRSARRLGSPVQLFIALLCCVGCTKSGGFVQSNPKPSQGNPPPASTPLTPADDASGESGEPSKTPPEKKPR